MSPAPYLQTQYMYMYMYHKLYHSDILNAVMIISTGTTAEGEDKKNNVD